MATVQDVFLTFCSQAHLAVSSMGAPHYSHRTLQLEGEISLRAEGNEISSADGDKTEPHLMPQNAFNSICSLISTQQFSLSAIVHQ